MGFWSKLGDVFFGPKWVFDYKYSVIVNPNYLKVEDEIEELDETLFRRDDTVPTSEQYASEQSTSGAMTEDGKVKIDKFDGNDAN
ncbi:hypothetical protein AKJ16_DCAP01683 [Drosera capensis]